MNKNILGFTDIKAGWMTMHVYDYINEEERKMRISYLSNFFDDLLMACKFLLSDITGIYEIYIDQEGFNASIRFYKWTDSKEISLEINEDFFEDEIPYNGTSEDWEEFHSREIIPTTLTYFNVNIKIFILNILELVEKNKTLYNEGFVLSPSDELNEDLLEEIWKKCMDKYLSGGEDNEEVSDT